MLPKNLKIQTKNDSFMTHLESEHHMMNQSKITKSLIAQKDLFHLSAYSSF